ncbi:MAG: cellulase family glycosylhydrolase [Armatimonadota bacterium]|nr:cellulase family glycosylhydrolase [bacterium]
MKYIWTIMAAVCALCMCGSAMAADGFLKINGSKLMLNGREYRAIGVNIPNLHTAYNGTWHHIKQIYGTPEKAKQAMIDAIIDAEKNHIAFVRFFAHPGYPSDNAQLYQPHREEYWHQMDEVVNLCRKHHVKLVPSLTCIDSWQWCYGEKRQAILDPNSKTYKMSYGYIREFVTRYKDDPTILMWELTNEGMLGCDVDRQGEKGLPEECFAEKSQYRETLSREDSLTWDMLTRIYQDQAAFIKGIDRNHPVTSGDASVRPECTSRRETFPDCKYRTDTLAEWIGNNLASQPEPLDVYSYHMYGSINEKTSWEGHFNIPPMELYRSLIRATHAIQAPVFVGEFGQYQPSFDKDPDASYTRAFIDEMDKENVSLAALWVWHFPWQPENDVRGNTHPLLIQRIAEFNAKYAKLK